MFLARFYEKRLFCCLIHQRTKRPRQARFAKVQFWTAHGWRKQAHLKRLPEWLFEYLSAGKVEFYQRLPLIEDHEIIFLANVAGPHSLIFVERPAKIEAF